MSLTKKIISSLQEAHQQGKDNLAKVAAELRTEIETYPEMQGFYCYVGTPLPIAYLNGLTSYFCKEK